MTQQHSAASQRACLTSAASDDEMGASISLNSSMLLAVLNRSSLSFDAGCPAAR